jgi:hypothetical protein
VDKNLHRGFLMPFTCRNFASMKLSAFEKGVVVFTHNKSLFFYLLLCPFFPHIHILNSYRTIVKKESQKFQIVVGHKTAETKYRRDFQRIYIYNIKTLMREDKAEMTEYKDNTIRLVIIAVSLKNLQHYPEKQ